jgi:2,3-bisphosphoglycerate-independent phosphoglycerate mutase
VRVGWLGELDIRMPPKLAGLCHSLATLADASFPTLPFSSRLDPRSPRFQGENPIKDEYNAIHVADTPATDALRGVPGRWRTIKAHGTAVGLPSDADMGNSEVGHNALGAGQVIDQGASLVDKALESGSMFEGEGWAYISPAFAEGTLHLIGLLSDGGVHSRTDQLYALIRGAAARGAKKICVHVLTDGRDVPDGSSLKFVEELEAVLADVSSKGCKAVIASGGGRMHVTMVS